MDVTHHIQYLHPGAFLPESTVEQIEHRDPETAARQAPGSAYCFTFFDLPVVPDVGLDPDLYRVVPTKRLNETKRYYIGGQVMNAVEVSLDGDGHPTLLSNMRANGWQKVVRCRTGNWQPFEDGDQVI